MKGQEDQYLGTPTAKFIENRTKVEITVNVKPSSSSCRFNWSVIAENEKVTLAFVGFFNGKGSITTPLRRNSFSGLYSISNIPEKLDSSTRPTQYKSILTFTITKPGQVLEFKVADKNGPKSVTVYTGPPFDTLTPTVINNTKLEVTVNVTPSTSTYEFNWTIFEENQNQEVKLANVKLNENGKVTTKSLNPNSYDGQYEIRNVPETLDPFHKPFKSILTFPVSNQTLEFQVDDDSGEKKSVKVTRPDDDPDDGQYETVDTVNPAVPVVVAGDVTVLGTTTAVFICKRGNRISQLGLLILGVGLVMIGLGLGFGLPGNTGALIGGIIFAGFGVVFYVIALLLLCGVSKCGNMRTASSSSENEMDTPSAVPPNQDETNVTT